MPDESCRNCGGKLFENTKCSQCFKPTSLIYTDCTTCTQEQFHSICMSYATNTVSSIDLDNFSPVVVMA